MTIKSYRDLEVWQLAIELADTAYQLTDSFPKEELYGLKSQIRRCSVSIASNIAEGSARGSTKELIQFLCIARGSLAELKTQLIISRRRSFVTDEALGKIFITTASVNKMLARLLQSLERKIA